jgi:two-component system phosphate regulon sensor histidine kinase PhoR
MRRRPLFWQIFLPFVMVTLAAIAVVTWFVMSYTHQFFLSEQAQELESRAVIFRAQLPTANLEAEAEQIDRLTKRLGRESHTRITVILPSGKVIADTDEDPAIMENHGHRPEIQTAMGGKVGIATRYSFTLYETMMYAAVPVVENDKIVCVVRVALPLTSIEQTFGSVYDKIVLGALLVALLAALSSLYISRRITRPLVRMRQAADHFRRGEFQHRLPIVSTEEIADLGRTMNEMAAQLDEKMRTVIDQRNEREAILSSMVEGVIAFDNSERVINLNQAAADMLSVNPDGTKGRLLHESIRNANLQRFVSRIMETGVAQEEEIQLADGETRVLRMLGTVLQGDQKQPLGAVVVLHDITRLHQLERIRRDFVANVSHELRTPITSIKGFAETLRDGSVRNPDDVDRFLGIIARQADRLNTIISDLLTLSELEQADRKDAQFPIVALKEVLESAVATCEHRLVARKIRLEVRCDECLKVAVNPDLFEQAVVNLIDNAAKYSDPEGAVMVSATTDGTEVIIAVEDHGVGIEKSHLPRLFERFYRVDRARSRELGGTGLGLSIVRHIVLAHRGRVDVTSTPGKGSTFFIHLPAPDKQLYS